MNLRDYQRAAFDKVLEDLNEVSSTLVVKATGLGKTILFAHTAKHFSKFGRVLIVAHRDELIRQAVAKVGLVTGKTPDIEMGMEWADRAGLYGTEINPFVVATVQSLCAGMNGKGRMSRFSPHDFALVIFDEAHHCAADSYKRVFAHFRQNPCCKFLGVTATPDRGDEAALGQIFERVSFVYEINDGIDNGWLVNIEQRHVHVEGLDFSQCRTTAGDFNGADLNNLLQYEKVLHGIVSPTFEIAGNRKTLVFTASVGHGERVTEILNRHRPGCARFVCGTTDETLRRRTLRAFKEGAFQFLVNCAVFTEGFDEPSIELVVIARPTKSRALYAQMVGRGTRPLTDVVDGIEVPKSRRDAILQSAKPKLEVLDFVGNAGRHKLITTADILGGKYSDEVVEIAERKAKESTKPVDMKKLLETSEEELERRRQEHEKRMSAEAATRARLVAIATYSTTVIDAFKSLEIKPGQVRGWDKGRKATPRQVEVLRKFGIDGADQMNMAHAGQLLTELIGRSKAGKCTWKQSKLLKRFGYDPDSTFDDAKRTIDELARNNWRRPGEAAA